MQVQSHIHHNNFTNFNGLRQVINASTIADFLKKTQNIADIDVFEKTYEKGKLKLKPKKVALIKCKVSRKEEKDSKILYCLFDKNYTNAKTVEDIDACELGLAEVKYKNLKDATLQQGSEREIASVRALKKAYQEGLKILHLISFEGDKYKGIGTTLLDTIVQKSKEMGLGGKVFLYAKNLFPEQYLKNSAYCKKMANKSPIKFYYNYGFRADETANRLLETGKEIDGFTLHLPQATINQKLSK